MFTRPQSLLLILIFLKGLLSNTQIQAQTEGLTFSNELKQQLIRNQFVKIKSGQSNYYFGGFGTYTSEDNSASLNFNKITSRANIWNLQVAGGASDGFLSIFKNRNFASDVKLGLSFNLLLDASPKVFVSDDSYRKYMLKQNEIEYKYKMDTCYMAFNIDKLKIQSQKSKDSLTFKIDSISNILKDGPQNKDSLMIVSEYLEKQRDLTIGPNEFEAKKKHKIEIGINDVEPEIIDFYMHWITFDINGAKNSFSLYDSTTKVISSKKFNNVKFNVQYSVFLKKNNKKLKYFNSSLAYNIADNRDTLAIETFGDNTGYYNFDYKRNLNNLTLNLNYFQTFKFYIFDAFHLKYENIMRNDNILMNLQAGLLMNIRGAENTKFNLEIYLKKNAFFAEKQKPSNLKFNEIGFNFGMPFKFLNID